MKILPHPIDYFFRPGGETIERNDEARRPQEREGSSPPEGDRVDISPQGRKEQIQQEMVAEIIRKIR